MIFKENHLSEVEERLSRAITETGLPAPSLGNVRAANREVVNAFKMLRHMRRVALVLEAEGEKA